MASNNPLAEKNHLGDQETVFTETPLGGISNNHHKDNKITSEEVCLPHSVSIDDNPVRLSSSIHLASGVFGEESPCNASTNSVKQEIINLLSDEVATEPGEHPERVFEGSRSDLRCSKSETASHSLARSFQSQHTRKDDDLTSSRCPSVFVDYQNPTSIMASSHRRTSQAYDVRSRASTKVSVDFSSTNSYTHEHVPGPFSEEMQPESPIFVRQPVSTEDLMHERNIVRSFNALSSEERRLEIVHALFEKHIQPYERRPSFTADTWDKIKRVGNNEKNFAIQFDRKRFCFYVTLIHRKYRLFLFSFLLRLFCFFLLWVIMYCLISPTDFIPGGLYFDTATTIFFAGVLGTVVSRISRVPSLVCIIAAGILYNNIPTTGYLTSGISSTMRVFVGTFGLAVGVLRAGLSLNITALKENLLSYMMFGILPMAAEAVVHGFLCKELFGYPNFQWAMMEGFIVSAIAPSVVAPALIDLQRKGYGTRGGPAMMLLTCTTIDAAICVWAIQLLLAFEFSTMSRTLAIILAPVQMIAGFFGGIALGGIMYFFLFYVLFKEGEWISVSDAAPLRVTLRHATHARRWALALFLLLSFAVLAAGRMGASLGGAGVGASAMAAVFGRLSSRRAAGNGAAVRQDLARSLATVWDYAVMPALFALTGADIDVHEVFNRDFIGYAIAVTVAGLAARFVVAVLTPRLMRMPLTWRELLFCGIGSLGKGSVQGALGAAAMINAQQELLRAVTEEEIAQAERRVAYGRVMKNTAVLSMLIACPLCAILIASLSQKLLKRDAELPYEVVGSNSEEEKKSAEQKSS
ncbi:mitochondrial sodium/hydrogen exchanger NHA2 [Trypanosoma theileri]|uniref:Mitochondrial sodium/hydrogen exchanger NHA2 n=1 Tax=Trypanosoma theileri TaxID=67003 RepID=A0A1X0P4B5_9TRYP|nr:mitochondrial sodium/hydrogen exchanger NHA2 [Trypanosoma theileri]ORC91784.1 mitochondrial sodium/hydrogen exchanger NHA2 [Trypanosoma theileri]